MVWSAAIFDPRDMNGPNYAELITLLHTNHKLWVLWSLLTEVSEVSYGARTCFWLLTEVSFGPISCFWLLTEVSFLAITSFRLLLTEVSFGAIIVSGC